MINEIARIVIAADDDDVIVLPEILKIDEVQLLVVAGDEGIMRTLRFLHNDVIVRQCVVLHQAFDVIEIAVDGIDIPMQAGKSPGPGTVKAFIINEFRYVIDFVAVGDNCPVGAHSSPHFF